MRKFFYWLLFLLCLNMVYAACKCRYGPQVFHPVNEIELLPATNSLQKLPEW